MGLAAFLWRFDQQVSYENYFISLHSDLGCGPLHAWQIRVLFGIWERPELIAFSHMHECIHTYIQYFGWEHVRLL